jgi:phytoene dehydrogenase-like protein
MYYKPYTPATIKSDIPTLSVDAIIIGSGVSGLTAASLLVQTGKVSVLVLERNPQSLGGTTHAFEESGFKFEIGLQECGAQLWCGMDHNIGNEIAPKVLSVASQNNIKWNILHDTPPYTVVVGNDKPFPVKPAWEDFKKDLLQKFPSSERALNAYREEILKVREASKSWIKVRLPKNSMIGMGEYPAAPAAAAPAARGGDGEQTIPHHDHHGNNNDKLSFLNRLLFHHSPKGSTSTTSGNAGIITKHDIQQAKYFQEASSHTVHDRLQEWFADEPELDYMLTFLWGKYGLPPQVASWVAHCMIAGSFMDGGVAYPQGGSSSIEIGLAKVIQEHGGKIYNNAPVQQILVNNGVGIGVEMKDGTKILAKKIISSIGASTTYEKLLPRQYVPKTILQELDEVKWSSYALIQVFIGFNGSSKELNLPTSSYWVLPKDPLLSHTDNTVKYFLDTSFEEVEFPYVHISFPSAKDESVVNDNKSTCVIYAAAHYDWFKGMDDSHVKSVAHEIVTRLGSKLYAQFPHLKEKTAFIELATPLSHEFHLGASRGSVLGLGHIPSRFSADWLKPKTCVPNVILSGQDILTMTVGNVCISGYMSAASAFPEIMGGKYGDLFFRV